MENMLERTISTLEGTVSKDELLTLEKNMEVKITSVKEMAREAVESATNAEQVCARLAGEAYEKKEKVDDNYLEERLGVIDDKHKRRMAKVHEWMQESQQLMREWTQKMDTQVGLRGEDKANEDRESLRVMVDAKVNEGVDKMGELLKK